VPILYVLIPAKFYRYLPVLKSPEYRKTGFGIAGIGNTNWNAHIRSFQMKWHPITSFFWIVKNSRLLFWAIHTIQTIFSDETIACQPHETYQTTVDSMIKPFLILLGHKRRPKLLSTQWLLKMFSIFFSDNLEIEHSKFNIIAQLWTFWIKNNG
jgi:hypothetical protein